MELSNFKKNAKAPNKYHKSDLYDFRAIIQVFDSFVYETNQNCYLIQWTINNCKWIIESQELVECDLWMNRSSQFCAPDKQIERDILKQKVY